MQHAAGFLVDQFGNPLSGYGQAMGGPQRGAGAGSGGYLPPALGAESRHDRVAMKGGLKRTGSDKSMGSNQSDEDSGGAAWADADSGGSASSNAGSFMSSTNGGSFNVSESGGSFVRSPNGSFVKMPPLSGEAAKGAKWSGSSGSSDRSSRGPQGSWGASSRDPAPLANQFRRGEGQGHHQFIVGFPGGGGGGYVIGLKHAAQYPPPPCRLSPRVQCVLCPWLLPATRSAQGDRRRPKATVPTLPPSRDLRPLRLLRTNPREHAPKHGDVHERRSPDHSRTSLALCYLCF